MSSRPSGAAAPMQPALPPGQIGSMVPPRSSGMQYGASRAPFPGGQPPAPFPGGQPPVFPGAVPPMQYPNSVGAQTVPSRGPPFPSQPGFMAPSSVPQGTPSAIPPAFVGRPVSQAPGPQASIGRPTQPTHLMQTPTMQPPGTAPAQVPFQTQNQGPTGRIPGQMQAYPGQPSQITNQVLASAPQAVKASLVPGQASPSFVSGGQVSSYPRPSMPMANQGLAQSAFPPSSQVMSQPPPKFGPPVHYPQGSGHPSPYYPQQSMPPSAQFKDMSLGTSNAPPIGSMPPPTFGTRPPAWQPTAQQPSHSLAPPVPGQIVPPMPPPVMDHMAPGMVGMSQQAAGPTSGSSRVDPNQIPRPQSSTTAAVFETMSNGQANLPPPATSNFIARDIGSCNPRVMRSTLYQIPCTGDMLTTSAMPLALLVQPLALPHPAEDPIKVVDFGDSGPVRCGRCKAYINPFMKFVEQGRRFICAFCGHSNETPRDYFCNLGPDGRRRDADERPELSKGTVEFVGSKEFSIRPPMPPVFFFVVDVSANAVKTGATAAACNAIQRVLSDLPEGRTLVGMATFDSTIHFYNLSKALQQPPMLVVPDVQDVYTPIETGLVVPISECREQLEQLLESIPSMFQENRVPESAFGAAAKGAFLALKSTGGKLLIFQSVLPSIGVCALSGREAEGRTSAAGEKEAQKLLQPVDKSLKTMAIDFADFQVCVDLFLTTQSYVDIASLGVVPRTTGGQIYYYFPFSPIMDSAKLYNDLRWNVTRPQGLEAVMRVRCSQGLEVQDYFGNFSRRIPTDVDLPAIDCDKTILVTLKHDDKFQEGSQCCFQSALLYTTMDGHRRVRVSTLALPCTNLLNNLFRGADLDAQYTYFLKTAAQVAPTSPLSQVREQAISQCINILYTYRKFCATASSSAQLILPEALKLLPLYTLALIKSIGLRADARLDERSYWLTRVASLPTPLSVPLVYPRLFAVHNLSSKEIAENGVPTSLALSSEVLEQEGIYLLENGEDAYIYAGKEVSSDLLYKLFGVHSVSEGVPGQFILQEFDNEASQLLNKVVNEIRKQRCSYLRLHLVKRGDPLEFLFHSFLVEDKSPLGLSYVEFLVHTHKQIQQKMQSS